MKSQNIMQYNSIRASLVFENLLKVITFFVRFPSQYVNC